MKINTVLNISHSISGSWFRTSL